MKLGFDLSGDFFRIDGALLARLHKTGEKLLLVEELLRSVLLDDDGLNRFNNLKGGKSLLTNHTFATAADIIAFKILSGIYYLTFKTTAMGTFHIINTILSKK